MADEAKDELVDAPQNSNEELDALDVDDRLAALEEAERAIDRAYSTGRADRAKITQMAQLEAADAVAMTGVAMESDDRADEATRMRVIIEKGKDREKIKIARQREREARKKANADHKEATRIAKNAYEAIKFSAPNKMGFMRAVQVLFAVHIAIILVFLIITTRDNMIYDVSGIVSWVMVIFEGVAFWTFINRYKIGRSVVMIMAAVGVILPAIMHAAQGNFSLAGTIGNGFYYIFLFLYFTFSKRVKAVLVNDFAKREGDYDKDNFVIERRGWPFFRNLIMYFIIFSLVGHWMEMGLCQFIIMGLVEGEYDPSNTMLWRDWLYPFPMEGLAVVLIALFFYPLLQWMKRKIKIPLVPYIISFIVNALLCSAIEFSMGLIVNADLQLWDYTNNFCNIMGQVCLQNTLAFGVAASIITWFVYPLLERLIARIPEHVMTIVFIVVVMFGAVTWSLYIVDIPIMMQILGFA